MTSRVREIEPGWTTVSGAAAYAGVAEDVIRGAVSRGELAAYKRPALGRVCEPTKRVRVRISTADVDAWIRETWEPVETFSAAAPRACAL